jgi:class 3 adenylate cyclase
MISKNSGVSLGHRKKLRRAIEALTAAGQRTGTTTARVSNVTEVPPIGGQAREAEFRQITVMFCDLVGSTQLSEKLDPEDLQKLIDAYRRQCNTAIRRYGGEVARYFGDGDGVFRLALRTRG